MNQDISNGAEVQAKKFSGLNGFVLLWLLVPFAIFFVQLKFEFFGIVGINFLYILLGLSLSFEVFVFKYYLSSEKKKDLPWIFLFVCLIQALAVLLADVTDNQTFWRYFLFFLFLLFFLLPEIIVAVLITIFYFIFKKKNRSEEFVKKLSWVGIIILIVGVIIFPVWNQRERKDAVQNKSISGVTNYDVSAVAFRQTAKVNTLLGKYKRPLRILREGDVFFGMSPDNERIPLPFLDLLHPDAKRGIYFDIFTDRVYFVKDEKGYVFDIAKNTTTLLPEAIQKALQETAPCTSFPPCNKRQITGAHNNTLTLQTQSLAGTGDVATFNIQTGERVAQTVYAGYNTSRVYLLWVDGQGYRLILDAKDDPYKHPVVKVDGVYTRSEQTIGTTMRIYLENHDEAYYMPSDDEFMNRWGKIVFTGGPSIYFKNRTPIFTLETNYPKARIDDDSKFSVRNLYRLEGKKLGLEVEDKLVIIDLETKTVRTTSDNQEIENLLSTATLLSSDQGACAYTKEIEALIKDNARSVVFCLM